MIFPLRPMGWAVALDDFAEPADIWHGMWAGSLPALAAAPAAPRRRTIYDSRDVFLLSRDLRACAGRCARPRRLERHWARRGRPRPHRQRRLRGPDRRASSASRARRW